MTQRNTRKVYCTYLESPEHQFSGHPESPKRIQALRGWLESPPYPEMEWLDFQPAVEADIALVHDQRFLAELSAECLQGSHEFEPSPSYVTESSYQSALSAAGATLAVSRRIIEEGQGSGFAIVRPPGHHAEYDTAMGFCLLNNIAIAVADAIASGLQRAAIVDFDAHHGNGTQATFLATQEVSYYSMHEAGIFPGTGKMDSAPHARGRIVNIPMPAFAGNKAYQQVLRAVVNPLLAQNPPEMIFVSAGFDAHFSDPLTSLTIDTMGYYHLVQSLMEMAALYCGGRIMLVLEGGYDPIALNDNIQACLAALSGHSEYPDHYGRAPGVKPEMSTIIKTLQEMHHIKE